VAGLAREWYGKNEHTDWIIKHGCRTLLKKGNKDVLAIFGFNNADSIDVFDFVLDKKSVAIGEELTFSFAVSASGSEAGSAKEGTKVRLEYAIDFVKAGGKRNRKIFQISEVMLKGGLGGGKKKFYEKKHSFENLSTRKHYAGLHSITLIVNGAEHATLDFELI
jgi:hypothetical protein